LPNIIGEPERRRSVSESLEVPVIGQEDGVTLPGSPRKPTPTPTLSISYDATAAFLIAPDSRRICVSHAGVT
jgi:hypothetical protein